MASAFSSRIFPALDQREIRFTYWVGLFLSVIAVIVMTQNYFKYASLGNFSIGLSLAYNLIVYTTFAALTPLIFYIGKRVPLSGNFKWQTIVLHLGISVLLGLIHMLFCNVVLYGVDLLSSIFFPRFLMKYLTNVIHFHLMVYWALVLFTSFRTRQSMRAEPIKPARLERLKVVRNGRTTFVDLNEVFWIEAMDHYQKIHMAEGYHIIKDSMKALEHKLPLAFKRIHRSYFVNTEKIEEIQRTGSLSVALSNSVQLKVGESYKKAIQRL